MLCAVHAETDPCLTTARVTGRRRKGTIRSGTCTACGWSAAARLDKPGGRQVCDHDARPDDDNEPGDRCKDCGRDVTWVGPSHTDWQHAVVDAAKATA